MLRFTNGLCIWHHPCVPGSYFLEVSMLRTSALVAAILFPALASANGGVTREVDVTFRGSADLFKGEEFRYDLDIIDSSYLAVTFSVFANSSATIDYEMDAASQLSWPEPLTQDWTTTGNPGLVGISTTTEVGLEVTGQAFGTPLGYELWREELEWEGTVDLDSMLLRGGSQFTVNLGIDGETLFSFEEPLDIGDDITITFGGEIFPELAGTLSGNRIETHRLGAQSEKAVFERLDQAQVVPPGTENPGYIDMVSTWHGDAEVNLALVLKPWIKFKSGSLTLGPFAYEFDVELFDDIAEVATAPAGYKHSLPALSVRPTVDFGTVAVGEVGSYELELANLGNVPLTGTMSIEGEGFAVLEDTLDVGGDGEDTVTLQFVPAAGGLATGTLTFETNDPINPVYEVSLGASGLESEDDQPGGDDDDDDDDGVHARIGGCGCNAGALTSLPAFAFPVLALLGIRRRRS